MQAWIPGVVFAYNGAAWFLSAALFCYAMSPVVSRLVCYAKGRLGGMARRARAVGVGTVGAFSVNESFSATPLLPQAVVCPCTAWPYNSTHD